MKKLLFVLAFVASHSGFAQGSTASVNTDSLDFRWAPTEQTTYEQHLESSLARLSKRVGVDQGVLMTFFRAIKNDYKKFSKLQNSTACVDSFNDSQESRNALLNCLKSFARSGLTESLYAKIFEEKLERIHSKQQTAEILKSNVLLAWIEDLIRENLRRQGQPASWYVRGKGFTKAKSHIDFPYEDGDVVLELGNSSVSAMITQSTIPQRRFSHAFVMRVRNGQAVTIEALIEKGVISNSLKKFGKNIANNVVVMRWKDSKTRAAVAKKASDEAWKFIETKTAYNIAMDMNDETRMFCSQLVAHAYSKAANLPISNLVPQTATIRSDAVFNYLKAFGVTKKEMPSPGDLMTSDEWEVVADYRSDDLYRMWEMFGMADVFVERLEMGYQIVPEIGASMLGWTAKLTDNSLRLAQKAIYGLIAFRTSIPEAELGILPESVSGKAIRLMYTQEHHLFRPAMKYAEKIREKRDEERNMFDVSLWVLRGRLSHVTHEYRMPKDILEAPEQN